MQLTKIPIVIYYGDNIPEEPNPNPGQDGWRVRLEMARQWRDTVNKYGGDNPEYTHLLSGIKSRIQKESKVFFPFNDKTRKDDEQKSYRENYAFTWTI